MPDIRTKRIYDEPVAQDGCRILVDRLWPRGVTKEAARLDLWLKEIAPSAQLRTEFGHMPDRFESFTQAYRAELDHSEAVAQALDLAGEHGTLTLLYAAKDLQHNHAVVLRDYLRERLESGPGQ
ncbi:DUF488 domain-containing protein [Arthrobacter sp. I2-34]|uniref:DUF488 domain-containing protein n=1 Tax=Arthrobacter hankyongi TaxID=2904801 RepID=A0ABS9LD03_9MICC|nr:DUF488 domain-containing protein [Arthrobacter hankyongi]MCG2624408.1 DUF488 domain-containing protein [Arthrobacter hankyongi]